MIGNKWKDRALAAEALLADQRARLEIIEAIQADRCALVSIAKDKGARTMRFGFVRHGKLTTVEVYADFSIDITALRAQLLEPLTND